MANYILSVKTIGPSLALEDQGDIFKLWSLMYTKLASTNPFRVAIASSPYTLADAADAGTINPAAPTAPELANFEVVAGTIYTAAARYLNKKK